MSLLRSENFQLVNNVGKFINGDIRYLVNQTSVPAVIILHGFKGFKDWGFIPFVAESLASAGAITVTLNFSMNGIDGKSDFLDKPEDFADNTISRQLADALQVLNYFKHTKLPELGNKWNGKIYLMGHSLGGAISLLASRNVDYIDKIALWATISTIDRYTERQKKLWRKKGYMEFVNMRTNQALKLNKSYLEDFEKNANAFSLEDAVAEYNNPLLIIHGAQDMTVPIKEAKILENAYLSDSGISSKSLKMKIIGNTGHTFGIIHPFISSNPSLDEAVKVTIDFFELT